MLYVILTFVYFGCSPIPVTMPILFEPQDANIKYIYTNGVPIINLEVDSLFFLISIEDYKLLNKSYFKLWILCQNNSENNVTIEPSKIFKMDMKIKDDYTRDLSLFIKKFNISSNVIKPSVLLNYIDNAKANAMIAQSIASALETMSVQKTNITSSTGEVLISIDDTQEKRNKIINKNYNEIEKTATWYDIYKQSINQGLLRKNTLLPNQSINGFVFIENKCKELISSNVGAPFVYDYIINIELQNKKEKIHLKAIIGE